MTAAQAKARHAKLDVEEIRAHDHAYYVLAQPKISDSASMTTSIAICLTGKEFPAPVTSRFAEPASAAHPAKNSPDQTSSGNQPLTGGAKPSA